MTKKQKEMIASAVPYPAGAPLSAIYVIPSGRGMRGVFTGNGFQHMILLGEDPFSDTLFNLGTTTDHDVIMMFHRSHVNSIDIPQRYGGAIRVCFSPMVKITDAGTASICPESLTDKDIKITEHPIYVDDSGLPTFEEPSEEEK